MLVKKIKIKIKEDERKLIVDALVEKRNKQIREHRPPEPVNEILLKLLKK